MNGNWLRVTPDELSRAVEDLEWAHDYAVDLQMARDPRWAGTDKTWAGLEFLLLRHGIGIPLVTGAHSFPDPPDVEDDEEWELVDEGWGYGPPQYLDVAQVALMAAYLAPLSPEDLTAGVALSSMAEVYPHSWKRPEDLRWAAHTLTDAQEFFALAAKNGEAVVCWLD